MITLLESRSSALQALLFLAGIGLTVPGSESGSGFLLLLVLAREVRRTGNYDHQDRYDPQTKASNHASRTESAPENIGEKKLPETALFAACINMMISTLPLALLNTQLKTITAAKNQHDVGVVDLPSHHERQMPAGDQSAEDQAGNECGSAVLQPGKCVTPPAGLLPCAADSWNEKDDREGREDARPGAEFGRQRELRTQQRH